MILCDTEIRAAMASGQILIVPKPPDEHITTSALDLTLGEREFKRWKAPAPETSVVIDPSQPDFFRSVAGQLLEDVPTNPDGSVVIAPGQFVLAMTKERVELPETSRLAARVEGRSSLARLGLGVHVTAPTIHSGFKGEITLEITNHGSYPIQLRPGMRICQLILEMLSGTPSIAMTGIFQNQQTVTGNP